ncbi:hypothetical protein [Nonomuraea sp. LPB2021202275-12-8]|uniref:hypothetical protein n=1 Tax=Nonomuraea sp. LPB2021202275-12-8 TaxID=3120159 RepID=UPI00300C6E12
MPLLSPVTALTVLMAAGTGSMICLRIYAGVTAPEIPVDDLRKAAKIFRELADDLDGGEDGSKEVGVAGAADSAAASVWGHNGGEAVDEFAALYIRKIMLFPYAFARDCRVIAAGCAAYATLVEDVNKRLAAIENAIMQLLWLVAFQPLTTALYGVAQAMAALQMARLIKIAQALKMSFGTSVARILQMAFPKYVLTTLNYAAIDGAAYAAGSIGIDKMVNAAYGLPLGSPGDTASEAGKIMAGNTAYILGYDVTKLGIRGPAGRGSEAAARLVGSGFGFTPVYNALDSEDDALATTPEQWADKLEGHGLRALIFPPGWRFR